MALGDDIRQCLIVPAREPSLYPDCPPILPPSSSARHHHPDHHPDHQRLPAQPHHQHQHDYSDSGNMEFESSAMSGHILSIDDFMAQRKSNKPTPVPAADPDPEPRAISARSSKHVIELHERHQALGIPRPDFVFEGGSMQGWKAMTAYLGKELSVDHPCGSKQEAKEKLSEMCLGLVNELEAAGHLTRAPKAKKQKMEHAQPVTVHVDKEPAVNYIGQLLEFQRSTNSPQPTYTDYQLGQSYSCEVVIEGHSQSFGSRTTFFTSKRAARHHAAACAVKYFQAEGSWPDVYTELGGIKKKKPSGPTSTAESSSHPERALPTPTDSIETATGASSYAQRVANLAAQLSLPSPEWRFMPSSAAAPGFHTVSCYFKDSGPHQGPLGEVRNVFGKKKAKEECARLVVQYLQDVKETRLEYARSMMAGIKGDTHAVTNRAVGKQAESEGWAAGNQHEDSDDDGFQSAVEQID